jgi:hypothetical protein
VKGCGVRLFDTTFYHMACSQTMLFPTSVFGINVGGDRSVVDRDLLENGCHR